MKAFSTLPVELIEAIALNLKTSDLCTLRLVSHTLKLAVLKVFRETCFSSWTVSLEERSLITLGQILEHPLGAGFKHLIIRGGLVDADRVAHEYHMVRYEDRGSDLGTRIATVLNGPYQPEYAAMLAAALKRMQTRNGVLESLTVEAPPSDWVAYGTRDVRAAVGSKAFFVTLDALARSGVKVSELNVLGGVQLPLGFQAQDDEPLEHIFEGTKKLNLCLHPGGMSAENYAELAHFLRMFKSLEVLELKVALARRFGSHAGQTSVIRDPLVEAVSQLRLKKLVLGRDYIGYDLMHSYLERHKLHGQLEMLGSSFNDRTDAFLQNSIWAQLESLELDNMRSLSAHYAHGECCRPHIGADGDDFKREFEVFHRHVAEVGAFGAGLY